MNMTILFSIVACVLYTVRCLRIVRSLVIYLFVYWS